MPAHRMGRDANSKILFLAAAVVTALVLAPAVSFAQQGGRGNDDGGNDPRDRKRDRAERILTDPDGADLAVRAPVSDRGLGVAGTGFCGVRTASGQSVIFEITNTGRQVSDATTVEVDFAGGAAATPMRFDVPTLGPNEDMVLTAPIPTDAGAGIVSFRITVDPSNEVLEQSEANNGVSSICQI